MENLVTMGHPFDNAYEGRRVLVTGHTGFKGAWLSEWLLGLGSEVTGYALAAPTQPSLHAALDLGSRMRNVEGDIRDADGLRRVIAETRPEFVFHLAAQPLVRASYRDPVGTFDVNVLGTARVLEALRSANPPCAVVCVTTDKCYRNREWLYRYREDDPLGGHDPYSASKAAAELVIASYSLSYFQDAPVRVASARAGNVIGGGDWAGDRIVPDAVRALQSGQPIRVRNPKATRPWQHVLEPLAGYLWLGARLDAGDPAVTGAFNFGPDLDADRSVGELIAAILGHWPGTSIDASDGQAPHEAGRLQLASDKAHALLGWSPTWGFPDTIAETVSWYREAGPDPKESTVGPLTRAQIQRFVGRARSLGRAWARTSVA